MSELTDEPGPSWWQRHFQREHDQQLRQLEEAQQAEKLRAALNEPFDAAAFAEQRRLLGLDRFGLDGQVHGELRRLS